MTISKSLRHIALFMAFMVGLSTIGIKVNVHYCKGHISGISLVTPSGDGCIADGDHQTGDCCDIAAADDDNCCSDKVQISSLELDGAAVSIMTWEHDVSDELMAPSVVLIAPHIIAISDCGSGTDPPDNLSPSGASIRVLYSSMLC